MGFVQSNVFMWKNELEFTQISHVDLHLRGNDYAKISKKTQTVNLRLDFRAYGIRSRNYNTWFLSIICKIEYKVGIFFKIIIFLGDMGGGLTRICPNC